MSYPCADAEDRDDCWCSFRAAAGLGRDSGGWRQQTETPLEWKMAECSRSPWWLCWLLALSVAKSAEFVFRAGLCETQSLALQMCW